MGRVGMLDDTGLSRPLPWGAVGGRWPGRSILWRLGSGPACRTVPGGGAGRYRPDFIGGQKFAAGLLVAGGCGAVGAFGNALVPGSDGFFPQHFGNVFVRTLLIPAEIYQRICITHQALPIVFEQGL